MGVEDVPTCKRSSMNSPTRKPTEQISEFFQSSGGLRQEVPLSLICL